MLLLCRAVEAPLKPEKVIGPFTVLVILGIELDTVNQQACFPQDKLTSLLAELEAFSLLPETENSCTNWQAGLCLQGSPSLTYIPAQAPRPRKLQGEPRYAIPTWSRGSTGHPVVAQICRVQPSSRILLGPLLLNSSCSQMPQGHLSTVRAYWKGAWFSQAWPAQLSSKPIEWKELYAIVMAAETWGHQWSGKRLL